MGRYMYAHILKRFEVSKVGNRNQLFYLDKDQINYVEEELKKTIDLEIYDIIKNNNRIEVVLKDNVLDKYFKSLVSEFNSIYQSGACGFLYNDENKKIDNASYFEQPLYGNKSFLISDNLSYNGYYVNTLVYSFFKDNEKYGNGDDSFISYLLTRLVRKVIKNKLSSAIVFSTD